MSKKKTATKTRQDPINPKVRLAQSPLTTRAAAVEAAG
jgi:hypothetical protein